MSCSQAHAAIAKGESPDVADYMSMVIRDDEGRSVFRKAMQKADDENEFEYIKMTDTMAERKVEIMHHPDLVQMSHIVAACKETDNKTKHVCFVIMNT